LAVVYYKYSGYTSYKHLSSEEVNEFKERISEIDILIDNSSCQPTPLGLDEVISQLVRYRAMIDAFDKNPVFMKTVFFQSWLVGMTYTLFSLLYKLVDKNKNANSLKNAWKAAKKFDKSFSSDKDVSLIDKWLKSGIESMPCKYRNLSIAHNGKNGNETNNSKYNWKNFDWECLDVEIILILKAGAILSKFSDRKPTVLQYSSGKVMFSGLRCVFTDHEVQVLLEKYDEFMEGIKKHSHIACAF